MSTHPKPAIRNHLKTGRRLAHKSTEKFDGGPIQTILLVENDAATLVARSLILRCFGYAVLEAGSRGEAWSVCSEHSGTIRLIMMETRLDHDSVYEFFARLQLIHPRIRALLLTGCIWIWEICIAVNHFASIRSRGWGANIPLRKVFLTSTQAALVSCRVIAVLRKGFTASVLTSVPAERARERCACAAGLDSIEDERQFDATDVEQKITSPDSNQKILEEIKRYAVEHEQQHGRFPKTLIFAAHRHATRSSHQVRSIPTT
jgi:response regulator RpfG family c-di-GMP phosphodiesterase